MCPEKPNMSRECSEARLETDQIPKDLLQLYAARPNLNRRKQLLSLGSASNAMQGVASVTVAASDNDDWIFWQRPQPASTQSPVGIPVAPKFAPTDPAPLWPLLLATDALPLASSTPAEDYLDVESSPEGEATTLASTTGTATTGATTNATTEAASEVEPATSATTEIAKDVEAATTATTTTEAATIVPPATQASSTVADGLWWTQMPQIEFTTPAAITTATSNTVR